MINVNLFYVHKHRIGDDCIVPLRYDFEVKYFIKINYNKKKHTIISQLVNVNKSYLKNKFRN